MIDRHHGWNTSFKPLFIGFTLSLVLTLSAYRIVTHYHLPQTILIEVLLGLGFTQAIVQTFFFLQVGLESKPHWNTITFLFMLLVLIIIIGGSFWIMQNLNYNVMPQ